MTSSHLFVIDVADDGGLTDGNGNHALVDAFDGIDALAVHSTRDLVAMANTCAIGFCIGGAGINFIDGRSRTVLAKSGVRVTREPGMQLP